MNMNEQDRFIANLIKNQTSVAIYLVNGIKLQGYIESQDTFVIFLKNAVTQMVYKHAISTIVPIQQTMGAGTGHMSGGMGRGAGSVQQNTNHHGHAGAHPHASVMSHHAPHSSNMTTSNPQQQAPWASHHHMNPSSNGMGHAHYGADEQPIEG